MTKSQPSVIKLRLSRLARALVALGCLKLILMGAALFDWPEEIAQTPAPVAVQESAKTESPAETATIASPAETRGVAVDAPIAAIDPEENDSPAVAADLAAAAKPRNPGAFANAILPAPLITGSTGGARAPGAFTPKLPAPQSLGAPLAQAGVILPQTEAEPKTRDDSVWNMLDLKSLPIPGLGSAQAAHAAALDMPVPQTPPTASPFTPAEQIVTPGTPRQGQLPAAVNQGAQAGNAWIPDPHNPLDHAPAPNIAPRPSSLDVNAKPQEIARQQQDMLMLRQQMDQRLKDLQQAEGKMKDMLREANAAEDQKVRGLVQMYSNMKPRMAAQAMEKMDERIAVRILAGMPPKQSGEILTYTNPAKTAKFTEMLTRLKTTD